MFCTRNLKYTCIPIVLYMSVRVTVRKQAQNTKNKSTEKKTKSHFLPLYSNKNFSFTLNELLHITNTKIINILPKNKAVVI